MDSTTVKLQGINRHEPDHSVADGWCDELVNMRNKKGLRWEPIGTKPKVYNLPIDATYNNIWVHDQDGILNFVGQDTNNVLKILNMQLGTGKLIKAYSGPVKVEFLKRFMIVIHDSGMDIFLFNEGEYRLTVMPSRPMLLFSRSDLRGKVVYTEKAAGADVILSKYYKALNDENRDEGWLTGGIMLRAAFRMYDGSYVLHSIPEYVLLGLNMTMYEQAVESSSDDNDLNWIKFYMGIINVSFNSSLFVSIDKNIFTDVVIFACKNEELFDFNEDYFDDDVLTEKVHNASTEHDFEVDFHDIFEGRISEDFKNMVNSPSWYKVHEISIEEIQNGEAETTQEIDMKGFYQDYATRETLTIDQFSHHSLTGAVAYNYNSRLIIGNVKTQFASYRYYPLNPYTLVGDSVLFPDVARYTDDWKYIADRNCKFIVTLNTSSGDVTRVIDAGTRPFAAHDDKEWMVASMSIFGYPDARAKEISVLVEQGGKWYKIHVFKLKASTSGNYAYYHSPDFSSAPVEITDRYEFNFNAILIGTDYPVSSMVNIYEYTNGNYNDENRIQVSEVNNPFYFPAKNSDQIGTGRIIGIAANTEPLSEGQFGTHPLQVFTTKGIWALIQGSGDVVFSNKVPVTGDVANENSILPVGIGVVYTTKEGVFIIQGKPVTELSKLLTGKPNYELQNNRNYQFYLTDMRLVEIVNSLSTEDAKTYLLSSKIGFDKENNELICTKPGTNYSYVYSFDTGYWHKINESYRVLINYYPLLYALRETGDNQGVIDISNEVYTDSLPVLLTTRPLKLGAGNSFKVIQRMLFETLHEAKTGTHAGFYYFASSDLINWQRITGRNHLTGKTRDILLQRSGSKFKYFVIVIAGQLKPYSYLQDIEITFQRKMALKPR